MKRVLILLGVVTWMGCSDPTTPSVGPATPLPPLPNPVAKPTGTVAERLKTADELAAKGEDGKAIAILEEAILIDSKDRGLLLRLAKVGQRHALALVKTDAGEAYRQILKAGHYLRSLREHYKDATAEEKTLTTEVLYDEATAHARSKRVEETTGSLRDLVGEGFKDFERIKKDPDWATMLAIPQFQKEWEQIQGKK